jgi:hypothetical protein
MDKLRHKKKEPGIFGKHRYWSFMLVGEHGRVIPVRRFKEIAFVVTAIALLSSLALVVLGFVHVQRSRTIGHLQGELSRLQQQTNLLKDERDFLKAKMVIGSLQSAAESNPTGSETKNSIEPASVAKEPPPVSQPSTDKIMADESKGKRPGSQFRADIRQFDARFNRTDKSLTAQFVIHNLSNPKEPLSGKTVLVFKDGDDPLQWVSVPRVPLRDGKPSGQGGQEFTVRNYRTLNFADILQKSPDTLKIATAYVFLEQGELLLERDFAVKMISDGAGSREQDESTPKSDLPAATPGQGQVFPAPPVETLGNNRQEESLPATEASGGLAPETTR